MPPTSDYIPGMTGPSLWIAQQHGQDWRDEELLAAIRWVTRTLDPAAWTARLDAVRDTFYEARSEWQRGNRVPLFDPADLAAWYIFQGNAYAADRRDWYEPEAYRIAPLLRRLGQLLPQFEDIAGAGERAARVLTDGRRQPDDGLYELLVAGTYRRNGWPHVEFVPEAPGRQKTHDINVASGRKRWAVECKRVGRSEYAADERGHGERLAGPVHELSRVQRVSCILEVDFRIELSEVPTDYLAARAETARSGGGADRWNDEIARGWVRPVAWQDLKPILACDDLYFGSSRMIELAAGTYVAEADHSVDGDWIPSRERPFHAHDVSRLSVVSWLSSSREAGRRKAKHFRSLVARASGQLPGDRPGVVHVGYELIGGNGVDARRDLANRLEMLTFDPGSSRLRWVYGNYMVPEHTTHSDEASALTETTATYQAGKPHRTPGPLPFHQLFSDPGPVLPGGYWLRPL